MPQVSLRTIHAAQKTILGTNTREARSLAWNQAEYSLVTKGGAWVRY